MKNNNRAKLFFEKQKNIRRNINILWKLQKQNY